MIGIKYDPPEDVQVKGAPMKLIFLLLLVLGACLMTGQTGDTITLTAPSSDYLTVTMDREGIREFAKTVNLCGKVAGMKEAFAILEGNPAPSESASAKSRCKVIQDFIDGKSK